MTSSIRGAPALVQRSIDERADGDSSEPLASEHSTGIAQGASRRDRFMLRLLRIKGVDRDAQFGAHRAFRLAVVLTAIRCTFTYLLIPVLMPLMSLAGVVAAPLGVALCLIALVSGVVSLRRFWRADHRAKWKYTIFMAVVFAVLAVALTIDLRTIAISL